MNAVRLEKLVRNFFTKITKNENAETKNFLNYSITQLQLSRLFSKNYLQNLYLTPLTRSQQKTQEVAVKQQHYVNMHKCVLKFLRNEHSAHTDMHARTVHVPYFHQQVLYFQLPEQWRTI